MDRPAHAKFVKGLKVVETAPAQHRLARKDGEPGTSTQVLELMLEDASIVYGCAQCDYTNQNPDSITPHLQAHKARRTPVRPVTPAPAPRRNVPTIQGELTAIDANKMTVAQMLQVATQFNRVVTERDDWKGRALTAERKLRDVNTVLRRTN